MKKVAALALLASIVIPAVANAQSAAQMPTQAQASNGVIMQVIQPGVTVGSNVQPNSPSITSMAWIYDTTKSKMMLCKSFSNGEFACTASVPLNWGN